MKDIAPGHDRSAKCVFDFDFFMNLSHFPDIIFEPGLYQNVKNTSFVHTSDILVIYFNLPF